MSLSSRQLYHLINQKKEQNETQPLVYKTVVGFTPNFMRDTHRVLKHASIVKQRTNTLITLTTDENLCILPANSIIDMVEFYGIDKFETKGTFSIGLGQLNDLIILPLIEKAKPTTANEKNGGCRQFISISPDGSNEKHVTLYDTPINVNTEHPIISGNLLIIVHYHSKF